jgi:hypothetical protein
MLRRDMFRPDVALGSGASIDRPSGTRPPARQLPALLLQMGGISMASALLTEINGSTLGACLHTDPGSISDTEKGNLVQRKDASALELWGSSHA